MVALRACVAVCAVVVLVCSGAIAQPVQSVPLLSARQALETHRLLLDATQASDRTADGAVSIAPDGARYVIRVLHGDADRNVLVLRVLAGRVADATAPTEIVTLTSSGRGSDVSSSLGPWQDASPYFSAVRWLDGNRVAFLWSDAHERRQVVSVDIEHRTLRWLTHHGSSIAQFDVAKNTLVYSAEVAAATPTGEPDAGLVIGEQTDGIAVARGDFSNVSLSDQRNRVRFYRASLDDDDVRELLQQDEGGDVRHRIVISPDARWALIDLTLSAPPRHWDAYAWPQLRSWLASARAPLPPPGARNVHQWHVVDLQTLTLRPLWNAPSIALVTKVAWAPSSRWVVMAPTATPLSLSLPAGHRGAAAVVINRTNGAIESLPVELAADEPLDGLRFIDEDTVELLRTIDESRQRQVFRRQRGQWLPVSIGRGTAEVSFHVAQDLNAPPRLCMRDRRGHEHLVLDLNPSLHKVKLGRVRRLEGVLSSGEAWSALLFAPVDDAPGRRYPLVIQSVYAMPPSDAFTLYGAQEAGDGLGPSLIAAYPGQLLAARNVMVLHLNVRLGDAIGTEEEAPIRQRAFEEVAELLVRQGSVDRERVGLLGFSRNGYYVEHTLSHSQFPFAAALSADSWDPSYLQTTLSSNETAASAVMGARPFADGLSTWLRNAPAFNAERVRAPLLMIEQSQGGRVGVLLRWEMFSRLRSLQKPVEFWVMPDALRGAHNTQNPRQLLAVQARSVEWFDFWLNGHEDPDPSKRALYASWRALRARHALSVTQ